MSSIILGAFTALILVIAPLVPPALEALGIHPETPSPQIQLPGRKALIITTSQGVMPETGQKTGVWAAEMTGPYYAFLDAGMQVDLASIRGGKIPIEATSIEWPLFSAPDRRFLKDPELQLKARHSYAINALNFSDYDLIFIAGGWGAAYDLGQSKVLGQKLTQSVGQGIVHGAVCHGPLGFLQAKDSQGQPLVAGMKLTAVSDQQIFELGIGHTPLHPESALREAGALYEKAPSVLDVLGTHVQVDGQIVTGQNQNSALATAYRMMEMLAER